MKVLQFDFTFTNSGAALKCLRNPHDAGKVSGEEGRWMALSDRTLVPLADMLLAHIAK